MEMNAEQKLYVAAQYLAEFATNYVFPCEVESHVNLVLVF